MATSNLSPAQRALNFNQSTRQNFQVIGRRAVTAGASISFDLPKARLLAGVTLLLSGKIATSGVDTVDIDVLSPLYQAWPIIRRVTVSMNNGYNPFSLTGKALKVYNDSLSSPAAIGGIMPGMLRMGSGLFDTGIPQGMGNLVLIGGEDGFSGAKFQVRAELPITLNPRDPIGLLLLQDDATLCTVTVEIGDPDSIISYADGTATMVDCFLTAISNTFTIPASPDAFPDISVIKMVQERREKLNEGLNQIKLPVGTTYRKLFLSFDLDGSPDTAPDKHVQDILEKNVKITFNQADTPIHLPFRELAIMNAMELGFPLPDGVFMFDFSFNGLANLGGSRDYIDTERLTEFWVEFDAPHATGMSIFYEQLARLR